MQQRGRQRRARQRHNGFTLIELMIVVMVIGILAAIALPSFYRMRARAQEAGVKQNAHSVQLAAEDFATRSLGVYPTDDTTATPGGDTLSDLVASTINNPFDNSDATPVIYNGPSDDVGRVGYDSTGMVGIGYTIDGLGEGLAQVILLRNDGT